MANICQYENCFVLAMFTQPSYLHHSFYIISSCLDNQMIRYRRHYHSISFNDTRLFLSIRLYTFSQYFHTFNTLLPLYNLASFCIGIAVIQNKSGYKVLRNSLPFKPAYSINVCTFVQLAKYKKTKHQLVLPFVLQ